MNQGSIQVFVDDFVAGRLPAVCAITGVATTDQVRFRTNVSPLSPVWLLLILLGPIGWAILLAMAWSSGNYLVGWLPYHHDEARRRRDRRRLVVTGGVAGAVGIVILSLALDSSVLMGLGVLIALVGIGALVILGWSEPRFELDASRRWLTIRRVHPDFVAAVDSLQAGGQDRSLPLL